MNPRVCIYSNCQGLGIAHFMRKAGHSVESFMNYQLILREVTPEQLREAASKCDLFIYQPTSEVKHGDMSADFYIREVIPKHAKTVSFGYMFSYGMFPLVGHGDGVIGTEDLRDVLLARDKEDILAEYDRGDFDFRFWPRHLHCAAEQAKREVHCDVKMSEWMMENRKHRLLLAFNHPSSALFAELTSRVMKAAGLPDIHIPWSGPNEVNLPCTVPVSRYVVEHYGWKVNPDPEAHTYYRELLSIAWEKAHV